MSERSGVVVEVELGGAAVVGGAGAERVEGGLGGGEGEEAAVGAEPIVAWACAGGDVGEVAAGEVEAVDRRGPAGGAPGSSWRRR